MKFKYDLGVTETTFLYYFLYLTHISSTNIWVAPQCFLSSSIVSVSPSRCLKFEMKESATATKASSGQGKNQLI
jgi:hypothetical protein